MFCKQCGAPTIENTPCCVCGHMDEPSPVKLDTKKQFMATTDDKKVKRAVIGSRVAFGVIVALLVFVLIFSIGVAKIFSSINYSREINEAGQQTWDAVTSEDYQGTVGGGIAQVLLISVAPIAIMAAALPLMIYLLAMFTAIVAAIILVLSLLAFRSKNTVFAALITIGFTLLSAQLIGTMWIAVFTLGGFSTFLMAAVPTVIWLSFVGLTICYAIIQSAYRRAKDKK